MTNQKSEELNSEDLQLISVSYNLGLTDGRKKSWFTNTDSSYIDNISNEVFEKYSQNRNCIIALAIQEHTGRSGTQFQELLLTAINKKLQKEKAFTLQKVDRQEGDKPTESSFTAITKYYDTKSWQGTFIFAPSNVEISDLHHEHYRADHNQGKGGVTSTFTAKYSTNSKDTLVEHSIPLTFHGAHLSSDKKDGAYRRNLELMNMVQHFPTGQFLDYDALKVKARDYSYRFLLGDLNYRDNEFRIYDDTNPPTSRSSTESEDTANTVTTPSNQSFSPLKSADSTIDRVVLDSNGFTTQIPNKECSYQKSPAIRAQTPKRPSQNTSSVKTDEESILDDTASETSNSSEEWRVERDTGSLDLMVTLGGSASKIKIQKAVYVECERNPSDHKALVACSSVTHQKTNVFENVKSMVSSELANYGKVNETTDEFSGVKQHIDSLEDTEENQNHLVALFHLYRSIQDIRLQEHLLELALNPSEKVTQSSSCFSWLPSWTSWQTTEENTPAQYQDISEIKISGTLLKQANSYFKGEQSTERGKDVTIQKLTQEMNNTLDDHWEKKTTHLSREINTSWRDSLYKMLSFLCSCVFSQSPKAKPEPRTTENKLRKLRITDLPSDGTASLGDLKLHGLFAPHTTPENDHGLTRKPNINRSPCAVM